jgi:hypothetical protein
MGGGEAGSGVRAMIQSNGRRKQPQLLWAFASEVCWDGMLHFLLDSMGPGANEVLFEHAQGGAARDSLSACLFSCPWNVHCKEAEKILCFVFSSATLISCIF